MLNFIKDKSSNSFGCIRDLLSVNMFAVLLNVDSIEVDAGKRQKIALANLHNIGKSFLIFQRLKK